MSVPGELTEAQIRATTLAIARTKVMFGEGKVIQMYRRMALNVLHNASSAGQIDDAWARDYDVVFKDAPPPSGIDWDAVDAQIAKETKARKGK